MRLFLARNVHGTKIEGDLIFLDIEADAYFCLVDGADVVELQAGRSALVRDHLVAEQLVQAGLLSEEMTLDNEVSLPGPTRDLDPALRSRPVTAGWSWRALASNRHAARDIGRMDLLALVAKARRRPAGSRADPATDTLLDEVAAFRRLAPWLPHGGVCLMRSYQLLTHLRAAGHDVAWVFGVRAWPFDAHCWLQVEDIVLDDTLERVRAFKPIMVV